MRVLKFLAVAGLATALSATASAQVLLGTGGGATISDGLGGTWDTALPAPANASTAAVGVAVTSVDSVTIDGLSHTWIGDLQATLVDPTGVKHNLFVRPGYLATGTFVPLGFPWGEVEWAVVGMVAVNALAYSVFYHLIQIAGPVFATQMSYVVTIAGVAWGIAIFGEQHSLWVWGALALMLAGLALVTPRSDGGEGP